MLGIYWQTLRMKYMLNASTGRGYTQVLLWEPYENAAVVCLSLRVLFCQIGPEKPSYFDKRHLDVGQLIEEGDDAMCSE